MTAWTCVIERSDEIPEAAKEIMREMGINPENVAMTRKERRR